MRVRSPTVREGIFTNRANGSATLMRGKSQTCRLRIFFLHGLRPVQVIDRWIRSTLTASRRLAAHRRGQANIEGRVLGLPILPSLTVGLDSNSRFGGTDPRRRGRPQSSPANTPPSHWFTGDATQHGNWPTFNASAIGPWKRRSHEASSSLSEAR